MSRFVDRTATVEIPLSNGDLIWVREKLTAIEKAALNKALIHIRFNPEEGKVEVDEGDWHLQKVALVEAYLTGWNFRDGDSAEVPFSHEAIEGLDEDSVKEIASAIDKLQAVQVEAREKKGGKRSKA